MPLLTIRTNRELDGDKAREVVEQASRRVAELLGKPEKFVMVWLEDGARMAFAGTTEPLAYLELKSLGLPQDRTAAFSRALTDFVGEALEVPAGRVYIEFASPPRHMWGFNGGTF